MFLRAEFTFIIWLNVVDEIWVVDDNGKTGSDYLT